MWYVVWTSTGLENKARELIEGFGETGFVPRKAINMKIKGCWVFRERALFPGYLFVDTDEIEELSLKLFRSEGFSHVLVTNKKYFPLYGNDAILIDKLYNGGGLFETSEGYIEGDEIVVTSGPLCGLEGLIRRVDRHKRLAYIDIDMFGQVLSTSVGLEIVDKRSS